MKLLFCLSIQEKINLAPCTISWDTFHPSLLAKIANAGHDHTINPNYTLLIRISANDE